MSYNLPNSTYVKIDDTNIENVSQFTYLGHEISDTNDHGVAVNKRISLSWGTVNKQNEFSNLRK